MQKVNMMAFAIVACTALPVWGEAEEGLNMSVIGMTFLLVAVLTSLAAWIVHHLGSLAFRRLHATISRLPIAAAIVRSKDGELFYANASCRELLGVSKVENRFYYPEGIGARMMADVLRPLQPGTGFENVEETLQLGNSTIRVLISGQLLSYRWQSAWLLFFVAPTSQANPYVQIEQRVFQRVLNSLSELVYFQDKAGNIIGTNTAFDRFWRGRREEGLIQGDPTGIGETPVIHTWTTAPDGASRLLETNKTVMTDEDGLIIGTLSISHDVTDWHEMQESLKQEIEKREVTEQILAQRNTLLNSILNASQDPIGLYNEHGVYVGCNEPFAKVLGFSAKELIGKTARNVIDPEMLQEFYQTDIKVLRDGLTVKTDAYVILETGEPVWYEIVKSPYRDPTDGSAGVLLIARDVTERKQAEQQLADAIMELQELSFVDSLTKVANRRSFDEQLRKLWHSHMREQQPLTLILCDIDSFKAYNDNYGHQQGDHALQEVAQVFDSVIRRETDEVARYGGEEFAFLLPNTPLAGGQTVAGKIHNKLAEKAIPHGFSGISDMLTVSLGVATMTPMPNQDYGELIAMADKALYKAKADGRNTTRLMAESDEF
ncbi:diguanylate cyclase [Photobacterium sp. 2_MG-2023]|uniref:diguanylate cyclase n=1 Tax=Photobacterium arenosum TaxID=2774143 RepID=A0ABR9BJW1_9GAMM|nr:MULTISPECIES: diguanylate cyclase [Photobacterium]MBD8512757.1 diguanylate cyclase [Photobacterium arenosum]MDO6580349.1 diguanylate cyclase [Photobacterium sp. 2_MG-2023]